MDKLKMIKRLRNAGMYFAQGMTAAQLDRAEAVFGFRFPKEIRDFQKWIEDNFRFDLAHCREDMLELLAEPLGNPGEFDSAVMNYFRGSVKLIPFYAHRCFFDGMVNMPIVSFWQPVDSIFYGSNFRDYLEVEFLDKPRNVKELPEQRLKETGIWQYLMIL